MIAEILSFFAIWELGFWLLVLFASIIFTVASEKNILSLGVITTIIVAVIYHAPLAAILASPALLCIGFIGWIVIGLVWSMWRWHKHVKKVVEEARNNKHNDPRYALALSRNKSRITNWILYWPWSLLWNICGDFLTGIYDAMSGVYQKIVDKALKPLEEERKRQEEEKKVRLEKQIKKQEKGYEY